jgi:hypothetical protein
MSVIISIDFFTKFLRITRRILFCCSDSLEMLRGRSSESTTPCRGRRGGRGEVREKIIAKAD